MFYQWLYRYPSLAVDCLSQYRLIKTYKLKPLFGSTFISFYRTNQVYFQNLFAIFVQFLSIVSRIRCHVQYNGKENTDDDDVKGMYILLSGTLAVVTSAVRGTTTSPVVHVRCSLYPKIHPLV